MIDISKISKIGIGTWGIGGFAEPDPTNDDSRDITGLQHWFTKGANYLEIPFFYAHGRSAELAAQAYAQSDIARESLFITLTVHSHRMARPQGIYDDFRRFCDLFRTDYVDAVQVSVGSTLQWGVESTLAVVDDLLETHRARYFNVTNANEFWLTKLHRRYGATLFAHEIHFNFEVRTNEDLGIIAYADAHSIRNVIAQPLRRNRTATHSWPLLVELSEQYSATQNQILIAWQVARGMLPIPKSTNVDHIDELWTALNLKLTPADLERLNTWRPPHFTPPTIDWDRTGNPHNGVQIDQLSNVFDDLYASQLAQRKTQV